MKAIVVMFDSLNRRMLQPYGCDWVHTPTFQRLAERTVCFDNCYVGSMPCIPARRELHTGRYNFLHRGWGPLEPFDDSMPKLLKQHDIYTHLVTDHTHYWTDGGATYHTQYNSWEFMRGQVPDPWVADLRPIPLPESLNNRPRSGWGYQRQDWANRRFITREEEMPQARTFAGGREFLRRNHNADNWFLTIESYDPHEPYVCPQRFSDLYPHDYAGPHFDYPPYGRVEETPEQIQHLRYGCAALHSMCDHYLGTVLDMMDEYNLWDDTLLIVNTDHGFLLGEHGWIGKSQTPSYDEIVHTPLFIWDPRCGNAGERRESLVQTIDLPATLLEYFHVERPTDMRGHPLRETITSDAPVRDAALFGIYGGQVNVTDGRYVYLRGPANPDNAPLNQYTLMPTYMHQFFAPEELRQAELAMPFPFTKGCPTLRVPGGAWDNPYELGTWLYDLQADPAQDHPMRDVAVEERMIAHMTRLMRENDAPEEQYQRLGLPIAASATH